MAASAPSAGEVPSIDNLVLKDQFGMTGGLNRDGASVQLAIIVSAKRLRRIKPWEEALSDYPLHLPLVRIADVPRSSPADFDAVAEKLKKRLPEDLAVLIDLEGVWVQTFGLDSSVPNLLIFDGQGRLLGQHSGMFKASLFEALAADLDRLTESQE